MQRHLIHSCTVVALSISGLIFLGDSFVDAAPSGFLDFPIDGFTSSTAPVTAVLDHDGEQPNGTITTYTGEMGSPTHGCLAYVGGQNVPCTSSNKTATRAFARQKNRQSKEQPWTVSAFNYRDDAPGHNIYMWYDGHRGYDYAVQRWTPVYASARGKLNNIDSKWGQITLDHSDYGYKYQTIYTHMELVYGPMPTIVPKGFLLGWVSNVAPKDQPVGTHLHFVVKKRVGSKWVVVDPYGGSGEPRLWK